MKKELVLDYLTCGSPIFQVKGLYTFTSDSIQLAHFVKEKEIDTLVDLCSGSGVVGLEVIGQSKVKTLFMVELQKDLYEASKKSASLNKNNTQIIPVNEDVKNLSKIIPSERVDVVTVNPPYFKVGSGDVPENESRAMARHEINLTLEDIIRESSRVLKPNGKLYMIHINSRKSEIEKTLNCFGFKVEETRTLEGKLERILIESKKIEKPSQN